MKYAIALAFFTLLLFFTACEKCEETVIEGPQNFDCPSLGLDIGAVCDDSLETTINDTITDECLCMGESIFDCPLLMVSFGDTCDDGDPATGSDSYNMDCICVGLPIDSLDCPKLMLNIGDPCDDVNPETVNDSVTAECVCIGDTLFDCPELMLNIGDDCNDGSKMTVDDTVNEQCICEGDTLFDCPELMLNIGDDCNDGSKMTVDDTVNEQCICVGDTLFDCPELMLNIGDSCDDGSKMTVDDTVNEECICVGDTLFDCPELMLNIGDECNDGDKTTTNDMVDDYCICIGIPLAEGCTDEAACNFDPEAMIDDGSCIYATGCDECDGKGGVIDNPEPGTPCDDGLETTENDMINVDCECEGIPIEGCTDELACNYDPLAAIDDNSCIYATGCDECDGDGGVIDNPEVGTACDDGDEMTENDMIIKTCDCVGTPIVIVEGCTDPLACNYDSTANTDDNSCLYATGCDECDGDGGVIDNPEVGTPCDDGLETTEDDMINDACECEGMPIESCTDELACNYNPFAAIDDGSCIYATGCDECDGDGGVIDNPEVGTPCDDGLETTENDMINDDCECEGIPIVGCTDDVACNYDPIAAIDDGSCIYATGCDECDGNGGVIDNPEVGTPCDDGNPETENDMINDACLCEGTPITCGGNPTCATAQEALVDVIYTGSITDGTGGAGNICVAEANDASWCTYTPLVCGSVTVSSSIDPDNPDTRLSIYTGTCGALSCLVSDDDGGVGFTSIATFDVTAGETYFIQWDDRWSEEPFDFVITIDEFECP